MYQYKEHKKILLTLLTRCNEPKVRDEPLTSKRLLSAFRVQIKTKTRNNKWRWYIFSMEYFLENLETRVFGKFCRNQSKLHSGEEFEWKVKNKEEVEVVVAALGYNMIWI